MTEPWYIFIERHVITENIKRHRADPPIAIKQGLDGKTVLASRVILPEGSIIVYQPHKDILPSVRLVIQCDKEPIITK